VIVTLVNGDDDYNEAVAASAENFVWESMSEGTVYWRTWSSGNSLEF
jgi:hypothetical protein